MKNMFDKKNLSSVQGTCEQHGNWSYQVPKFLIKHGGQCPSCTEQQIHAEKIEQNNERYAQELARCQQKLRDQFEKSAIPKRYLNRSFDNYNATDKPQKLALLIAEKYATNFTERLKNGSGLILQGKPGTGKTHLACAIANHVIINGHTARFTTVMQVIRAIRSTWKKDSERSETSVLQSIINYDLLIIDEIGVQYESESEKLILFDVLNGRYESVKPTILITNLEGDAVNACIGERNVDRITEGGGSTIAFNWQSYRKNVFSDKGLQVENCVESAIKNQTKIKKITTKQGSSACH